MGITANKDGDAGEGGMLVEAAVDDEGVCSLCYGERKHTTPPPPPLSLQ